MDHLKIGWAEGDLTPEGPVLIAGQFYARVSEGIADPITATALVLDVGSDHAVMVSCDFVCIADALRDAVRSRVATLCPGLDPMKIILNATHTHTGPEVRTPTLKSGLASKGAGVELDALSVEEYVGFAVELIVGTIADAWTSRLPGEIAFGQDYAVIGHNRRWVDRDGASTMYGNTDTPEFRNIEGYEDHSVGVLATRNHGGILTGLIVNVPCPSQVSEHSFLLSADYWCETREELRRRLGDDIYVLAQSSAAGDQSPHLLFGKRAEERMLCLSGRTLRQEIAQRIANAVERTLDCIGSEFNSAPVLKHHIERVELPMTVLTESDAQTAKNEAERLHDQVRREKLKLETTPESRQQKRWYLPVTDAHRRMNWYRAVVERFETQKHPSTFPVEIHVLRLGEVAFATNPFEYYLDFGIYIKARSRAIQTFLVQLAGQGTYVPSRRSVSGGGYGAIPASNPVGPEGGRQLAEITTAIIEDLWSVE